MFTTSMLLMLIIGLVTVPLVMGAVALTRDMKLNMNWWKWTLTGLWYFLLLFCIYLDFTFMGEGEIAAAWKLLLFEGVILLILGVGLVRILLSGRSAV
ncbi:MAG: hypothetical protein HN352_17925 [Bacteroidetes bacterium]|jgi:hypothetical protein|nr:hypothetical protein [Bacteroidota bacterium]MBT4398773.1 hypothetical protein [Bacteroidota bacterium]MBT4410911.1 hypothetical protein [Bacteroidota bacterium]MBT5425063.1 hypothetical protein [Bacteroidota bacterium]MBT7094149.1 hypothetical protein [Bacteroidota bacterium]